MILKIKVKLNESDYKYYPTHVFFASEFINMYELKPMLAEINDYVRNSDVVPYIVNGNELHFKIEREDTGYVNLGAKRKIDFSWDDLEAFIVQISQMSKEEIFNHSRHRQKCIPRAVIYSAIKYFAGTSFWHIGKCYGYNHVAIMHGVKTTIPCALLSGDPMAIRLVRSVAERYGDEQFWEFCNSFKKAA